LTLRTPISSGQAGNQVKCPAGFVFCLTINACLKGEDCGPFEAGDNNNNNNFNDTGCEVSNLRFHLKENCSSVTCTIKFFTAVIVAIS
jgi:hypothetical protein